MSHIPLRWTALAMVAFAVAAFHGAGSEAVRAQGGVAVGDSFSADNACFVRLPDMPAPRYGGFGGFNEESGVLFYAGGAVKRSEENTEAQHDVYTFKMDGSMDGWTRIPYNNNVGFTQEFDKGCREMASVKVEDANGGPSVWASVGGKDGCDHGKIDTSSAKGGDYGVLMEVGQKASRQGVKWVPNSGVQSRGQLPRDLDGNKGKLQRPFAAYDEARNRIVFGQGTFDDAFEQDSQEKVYAASFQGSRVNIKELRASGTQPSRRFSSCAAYVKDDDQGLDGVVVFGGESVAEGTRQEVWWLDFSGGVNGSWSEITGLFSNMDDIGYRRGGACAYNPDTKHFYSWMGRASASVPDGSKRSNGVWRADLSGLAAAVADPSSSSLSWERLAKDNQDQLNGRRLIPSVYSWRHNIIFALGGRNDLDEYSDVWAIYPDVTGDDCANIDPYEPFAPAPTATPPPAPPTSTPDPAVPTSPVQPTPTIQPPSEGIALCPGLEGRVPGAAANAALGNPDSVAGFDTPCNPNVAHNPVSNPLRRSLGLRNPNLPFHPVYNGLILKCGCP